MERTINAEETDDSHMLRKESVVIRFADNGLKAGRNWIEILAKVYRFKSNLELKEYSESHCWVCIFLSESFLLVHLAWDNLRKQNANLTVVIVSRKS